MKTRPDKQQGIDVRAATQQDATQMAQELATQKLAQQGVKALTQMPEADREAVLNTLGGKPDWFAEGIRLSLTAPKKGTLLELIQQGENRVSTEVVNAADRVANLRSTIAAVLGETRTLEDPDQTLARATAAMAAMAKVQGVEPKQFEQLVDSLKLLQQLKGSQELQMIPVKLSGYLQRVDDLHTIAQAVGFELHRINLTAARVAAISFGVA